MAKEVKLKVNIEGGETVEKASGKVQSLRTQLKELKAQLASGNLSTEEFAKISAEAGKLQDKIGDVNQRVKNLASDTKLLDGFTSVATGIAGGFAAAQGAIALFGDENKDLQKTLVKVQGSVALLNGLQAVANTLNKDSALMTGLNTAATNAATFAKKRYAAAVGTATGAMKLFRIAGAALGIGLIIGAITLLISKFESIKNAVTKFLPSLDTLGKFFKGIANAVTDFIGITSDATRALDELEKKTEKGNKAIEGQIEVLEAVGGKEEEIYRKRKLIASNELLLLEKRNLAGKIKNDEYLEQKEELLNKEKILDINYENDKKKRTEQAKQDREKASKDAAESERKRVEAVLKAEEELYKEQQKNNVDNIQKQLNDEFDLKQHAELEDKIRRQEKADRDDEWEAQRLEKQKQDNEKKLEVERAYNEQVLQAENELQTAKFEAANAGLDLAQQLAGKNKTIADSLFAVQKGLAIAEVIVNAQKEIAAYASNPTWSLLPDGGAALKTAAITKTKIRAATSIATIAATAIGKYAGGSSGGVGGVGGSNQPTNQAPNVRAFQTNFNERQTGGQGNMRVYVTETDISKSIKKVGSIYSQATVD